MGIKIKNLQTGEFEKFNIPALKGEKGEPGEIESSEKVDYIGKQHSKLRDTMNANVDYIIKTAIGEFNYLDYEGQHITATNSIEGHARSAILKGQTLVNLSSPHDEREIVFNSRYQNYCVTNDVAKGGLKNGEKIFMSMEVNVHEVNIETPDFRAGTCREMGGYDHIIKTNAEICNLPKNTWVRLCAIREVKEVESSEQYSFWFGMRGEHPTNKGEQIARVSFRKPMWINLTSMFGKGKEPTLSECEKLSYFTGMQSVRMPVLTTTGKNLFDYEDFKNTVLSGGATTKYPINLEPNTTYTFSDKTGLWNGSNGYYVNLELIDENDVKIAQLINSNLANRKSFTFTTSNSNEYYLFIFKNNMNSMDMASSDFQIEQGTQPTSYEPYKSNILSASEDVELCGIGDVRDTLDCLTGEVTERIGEIVLDGSENWVKPSSQPTNTSRFLLVDFPNNKNAKILSNIRVKKNAGEDEIGIWCDTNTVLNVDTSVDTVESLKVFLSKNPINLQYSLATESIKTVALSDNHVYSYKDVTHYDCSSAGGSLVPTLSVDVPTDTQLTIQEQKATTQTLLIKNMDLQQSIKEVQAMNLAFNTALYNSFNSIREEVEDIKKHVSTNENLEGSF